MPLDQNAHQSMAASWKQFKQDWCKKNEPLSLMVALRAIHEFTKRALSPEMAKASWKRIGCESGMQWNRDMLLVNRAEEVFSARRDAPRLGDAAESSALTAFQRVSPSKTKCSKQGCGQFLDTSMRVCWNCAEPNASFDPDSFAIHKRGFRSGWKQNPEAKLKKVEAKDEKILGQVTDLMKELKSRVRKQEAMENPAKQAGEEKDTAMPAQEKQAALGEAVEKGDDVEEEDPEWNLNDPADVLDMLESSFPAADVEKAGYTLNMFTKICEHYLQFLKQKVPKAPLAHWIKKDLDAGILKNRTERIQWLQTYGKHRSLQYMAKPPKAA